MHPRTAAGGTRRCSTSPSMLVLLAALRIAPRTASGAPPAGIRLPFILEVGQHTLELRKRAIEPDDGTAHCNLDTRVVLSSFSLDDVAKPLAQAPKLQ